MAKNETFQQSKAIGDMKAIILQQSFTGKRELKLTTVPKPSAPADGEVLIAVKAW